MFNRKSNSSEFQSLQFFERELKKIQWFKNEQLNMRIGLGWGVFDIWLAFQIIANQMFKFNG